LKEDKMKTSKQAKTLAAVLVMSLSLIITVCQVSAQNYHLRTTGTSDACKVFAGWPNATCLSTGQFSLEGDIKGDGNGNYTGHFTSSLSGRDDVEIYYSGDPPKIFTCHATWSGSHEGTITAKDAGVDNAGRRMITFTFTVTPFQGPGVTFVGGGNMCDHVTTESVEGNNIVLFIQIWSTQPTLPAPGNDTFPWETFIPDWVQLVDATFHYEVTGDNGPPPVKPPKKVKDSCKGKGCDILVQDQSMGESVSVTGTPFFLRYQSDRVADRADANSLAVSHAEGLGGWTLNVHHVYDPGGGTLPWGWTLGRVDRDVVDYVELLTRVTCALCSGPRSSKMIQCSQHHPVRYEKKSQRL
jgi:hypothetical protein